MTAGIKPLLQGDVKFLAVHCAATPPTSDIGAKDIDRWHRNRGFLKLGYHYVIRRDGSLESGRSLSERGAHVEGHNHESVGICLVGGVDSKGKPEANFTEPQLGALKTVLESLRVIYPAAKVVGHRDFPGVAKACPSFDVAHWWATGVVRP